MLQQIDHIVFVCDVLEDGIAYMEQKLGVAPAVSGKHQAWGTHNALLQIGPRCYLEVIAPDPDNDLEAKIFDFPLKNKDRLMGWVYRPADLQAFHRKAHELGITFGGLQSGQRKKPDGSLLSWQISDLSRVLWDGMLPFLIDWGESQHPAPNLPKGGTLKGLKGYHPQAQLINQQLQQLGVDWSVNEHPSIKLEAYIETANGLVIIE